MGETQLLQIPRPGSRRVRSKEAIIPAIEALMSVDGFDREMFVKGLSMGMEGVEFADENRTEKTPVESPLEAVTSQPAWDTGYDRVHDFSYSIGAVVGAFATRGQVDVIEVIEGLTRSEQ